MVEFIALVATLVRDELASWVDGEFNFWDIAEDRTLALADGIIGTGWFGTGFGFDIAGDGWPTDTVTS